MPSRGQGPQYLTPQEVAEMLLVSPVTVRQWAQKGMIKAHTTPGGHRRFRRDEVERFARQRGMEIERENPLSILVVDDSEIFTVYLTKLLQKLPFAVSVETAHDGFEAGRKVSALLPDIVLLDLKMPGLDGFAVCADLKRDPRTAHIRVVAMTGYFTREYETKIREAGAEALLSKPFDRDVLYDLIGDMAAKAGK